MRISNLHISTNHLCALFTALVWGTTFVASKSLILMGFDPFQIMMVRFVVAYMSLWLIYPHVLPFRFNTDELIFALLGICGGSLYFFLEYSALQYTTAANVGLINSTVPIFSAVMAVAIGWSKCTLRLVLGSVVALVGACLVVLNGSFHLHVYPHGDMLAVGSSVCWAVYTILLKVLGNRYNELVISRRLFFYATITIVPFVLVRGTEFPPIDSKSVFPLLYLGLVASAVCVWLWNISINKIGVVITNNYLYLLPVISVLASAVVLGEVITLHTIVGGVLILIGIVAVRRTEK